METIRFSGLPHSLECWRYIVTGIGCDPGPIVACHFDVNLTPTDIETLQQRFWYAESGTGINSAGQPYKWNDCIRFKVVDSNQKVNHG